MEPGSLQVRSMAMYACSDADYNLLSKNVINDKQLELVEESTSVRTTLGQPTPDE